MKPAHPGPLLVAPWAPWGLGEGAYHGAIGQADHHLHREAVLLQVQASQLLMGRVLLVVLWGQLHTPGAVAPTTVREAPVPAHLPAHLQLLQLLHQGPGADEALVEQGEDGRTFQDSLPESPP